MTHPTIEQLRSIDLFDGLSNDELQMWADAAHVRDLAPGVIVAEQDQVAPFHLVLSGSLDVLMVHVAGDTERIGEQVAPTWVGALAALNGGLSTVRTQTVTPVTLASIEPEPFVDLVRAHRAVFLRVMTQVRPVANRVSAATHGRERLALLGTMAAGLAHELNNPAAAAQRAAVELARMVEVLGSTIGHFVESGVERTEAQALVALQRQALARADRRSTLTALQAADAEDDLLDALESLGVSDAWQLTEPLVAAGVDAPWVASVHQLAGDATTAALQWVCASLSSRKLIAELTQSTKRLSEVVSAVKSYAQMDRGDLVQCDVHEGLDTTLTVLGHKLKHGAIEIVRQYDDALPPIMAHGGQLNQVWTNLLDNAIDALGGRGTITITTVAKGTCVTVDIEDDGPGIAPELTARVFDPFFTTKAPGLGTGLGLEACKRIIAQHHRGHIDVDSRPGRTVFHVTLPLHPPDAARSPAAALSGSERDPCGVGAVDEQYGA
jgi:signal transduction histidine kinase